MTDDYKPHLVTRIELANLRDMDPTNVSRKHLPKYGRTKKYDLKDPAIMAFLAEPLKKEWEQARKLEEKTLQGDGSLADEKLKAEILLKKKQARKFDYEHSVRIRDTIPVELMILWIGAFRSGIETNLLTIGNKIARGDTELRDRIEKEIGRAIAKTKEGAAKALRGEKEEILKAINGEEKGTWIMKQQSLAKRHLNLSNLL